MKTKKRRRQWLRFGLPWCSVCQSRLLEASNLIVLSEIDEKRSNKMGVYRRQDVSCAAVGVAEGADRSGQGGGQAGRLSTNCDLRLLLVCNERSKTVSPVNRRCSIWCREFLDFVILELFRTRSYGLGWLATVRSLDYW